MERLSKKRVKIFEDWKDRNDWRTEGEAKLGYKNRWSGT